MGNRCTLIGKGSKIGVYLHEHGDRSSIEALLEYCKLKKCKPLNCGFGLAQFCQIASNFLGGKSVSIIDSTQEPYSDHGTYIIDNWTIVASQNSKVNDDSLNQKRLLLAIDRSQPRQIGKYIQAKELAREQLKIGDWIYVEEPDGTYPLYQVVGHGKNRVLDGYNVCGVPYIARYSFGSEESNLDNYILKENVKVE